MTSARSGASLVLHVSPAGRATWSGQRPRPTRDGRDGPLPSLAAARDALRRRRAEGSLPPGPVTVRIQAGTYEMPEPLRFTPEDSGTADGPVRYAAADGALPVLSGGRRLSGWTETTHVGQRCWTVDLPEVATGEWRFTRLYVNGQPRQRPRLPKAGYYRFTGLPGAAQPTPGWCKGPDRASFTPGEIRRWHNWADVELVSYELWFDTHHRLRDIDEAAGLVHFEAQSLGSLRDERGEFARYFVENVFEALDTPGEWYLDRPAGRLSYLPLPDETLDQVEVVAPRLTELMVLEGGADGRVGHLRFENVAFHHQHWDLPPGCPGYIQAAFGVPGAVVLRGAEACALYGCQVGHVNGYGIEVLADSTENVIAGCTVFDAGGGGVKIGHEEMQRVDETAPQQDQAVRSVPAMATTVADCTVRDCGRIYPSAIGIWVGNSGWNALVHNHILRCNYTGISCGWTWGYGPTRTVHNQIEYNHIHHINHREILSDNGGIYTLGIQPGTVLRGNVIHDISCYGYGAWGIYPDEGTSEVLIEDNIVCGTRKAAFSTHYGRDNLVRNNILALSEADHVHLGKPEAHRTTVFRTNVCLMRSGRVAPSAKPWSAAHYTVEGNLFWTLDGTALTFAGQDLGQLQEAGQNLGAVVADPRCADAESGDFSLPPDSPAVALGFQPLDARQAGPRFGARRPRTFAQYCRRFALPERSVPVIRLLLEPTTTADEWARHGRVEIRVTARNVGRAAGRGRYVFGAGPQGAVRAATVDGRPVRPRADADGTASLAFALEPGEEIRCTAQLSWGSGVPLVWLDAEPEGDAAVPARCLLQLEPSA